MRILTGEIRRTEKDHEGSEIQHDLFYCLKFFMCKMCIFNVTFFNSLPYRRLHENYTICTQQHGSRSNTGFLGIVLLYFGSDPTGKLIEFIHCGIHLTFRQLSRIDVNSFQQFRCTFIERSSLVQMESVVQSRFFSSEPI